MFSELYHCHLTSLSSQAIRKKKFGLMRGYLIAQIAKISTRSLPTIPLWLGIHTKDVSRRCRRLRMFKMVGQILQL